MRSLFLILLLAGSAHGLFGSLGQLVTNLWNGATGQVSSVIGNVVDSAGNVYGQLVSTANGIQFAANFLWDNVFGPAHGLLIEGGQLFLDDKFGNIISAIGRRSVVQENALSEKYHELAATFKSNIHQVYNSLFALEHAALLSLQQGEHNLEERIRSFHSRINEIHEQINQWAVETKTQLEQHAQTLEGNWVHALQQYSQNLELTAKTMRSMLQQLTQDLIKNLLDVAMKVISGAAAIIENIKQQGLLSFLPQ